MIRWQLPRRTQPPELTRINPRHWLARDLVFAHSGRTAFAFQRPIPDSRSTLRGSRMSGTAGHALGNVIGWKPDGVTGENYDMGAALNQPLTLSAWWYGVAGTTNDSILCTRRVSGSGGVLLRRSTSEVASAQSWDNANSANTAAASGGFVSGQWQHGVGVFVSNTSRFAYADGGNSGTNTGSCVVPADCTLVGVATDPKSPATFGSSVISGIALPIIVARALSADEVARLYSEQLANPWGLFTGPTIMVPVAAPAAAFKAAWARGANSVIGAGARGA